MDNEKFNITELIEFYHTTQTSIPEPLKKFNFLEKADKICRYVYKGASRPYHVEETLALNIIRHLPHEAYKDLFTLDWIKSDTRNDGKILYAILTSQRFDTIEMILNKIEEWQKLNIKDSNDANDRSRVSNEANMQAAGFLEPMRDMFNTYNLKELAIGSKELTLLIPLWERSLSLFNNMQHLKWINGKTKSTSNIWELYQSVKDYSKDSLLQSLIKKPVSFELFNKLFKVISDEEKQSLFFHQDTNLCEEALLNKNKKVIELLEKENLINPEHYKRVIFKLSNYAIVEDDATLCPIDLLTYTKIKVKTDPKYKETFEAHDLTGMLLSFKNNPEIVNEIILDYPQFKTDNIIKGKNNSLAELNFLMQVAQEAGLDFEYIIKKLDNTNKNIIKEINFLIEKIQPEKKITAIEGLSNCVIYDYVIEGLCNLKSISYEASETLFLECALNLSLKDTSLHIKKIKI